MQQEEQRPQWPIGTILDADYSVGYWPRRYYAQVVGHTKSGAPRVVLLQHEVVNKYSSPVDSNTCHRLRLPIAVSTWTSAEFAARWRKKNACWGIVVDRYKPALSLHEDGSTFNEPSYG